MDLETENRIAAILMKEAAELRRQAARDGVDAYLRPNIRGRPNSRFLTATVLGVQQSNRAVEVNEMWRAREKEKELDERSSRSRKTKTFEDHEKKRSCGSSSSKNKSQRESEDGLSDKEIEEFLHSRAKRGRGAVGSRMHEMGPSGSKAYRDNRESTSSSDEEKERRAKRSRKHRSKDKKKKKKKRSKHDK